MRAKTSCSARTLSTPREEALAFREEHPDHFDADPARAFLASSLAAL